MTDREITKKYLEGLKAEVYAHAQKVKGGRAHLERREMHVYDRLMDNYRTISQMIDLLDIDPALYGQLRKCYYCPIDCYPVDWCRCNSDKECADALATWYAANSQSPEEWETNDYW